MAFYELKILMVFVCVSLPATLAALTDVEGFKDNIIHPDKFVFRNVCYPSLGCFHNGPPFYDLLRRPFSPSPREVKNVTFPLFTPGNPTESYDLESNKNSIQSSPFNCKLKTKIVVHGYNPKYDTFLQMKNALLKQGDYNVIVPDYQQYVKNKYYQAAADARTVGVRIANLIKLIMDVCHVDATNFHIIGHSLGAHVSGYAGKIVPNIGRISGLDPAGPYFQNLPKEIHLDADDANFVDVIHTNGAPDEMPLGFGCLNAIGDMDFFVNDGSSQPGCKIIEELFEDGYVNFTALASKVACSHTRASYLYIASITRRNCQFKGVKCGSFDDFEDGKCNQENSVGAEMGFYSHKITGVPSKTSFIIRTRSKKPYCLKNGDKPGPKKNVAISSLEKVI